MKKHNLMCINCKLNLIYCDFKLLVFNHNLHTDTYKLIIKHRCEPLRS